MINLVTIIGIIILFGLGLYWTTGFNLLKALKMLGDELKERREEELLMLRGYHQRLEQVTSELLSKANEIDQQSKYCRDLPHHWSDSLAGSCRALVSLTEQLAAIQKRLRKGQTWTVRERLLQSSSRAMELGDQLRLLHKLEQKRLNEANGLELECPAPEVRDDAGHIKRNPTG
jgi:hypothetical protein